MKYKISDFLFCIEIIGNILLYNSRTALACMPVQMTCCNKIMRFVFSLQFCYFNFSSSLVCRMF